MLVSLTVDNLALIEHEEIEFGRGLNILSGETGAGKSILLGALGLALGGKASQEMIRDPEKPALVEAVFSVMTPGEMDAFRGMEIEPYDDQVILSRKLTGSRAVAKINGESVPSMKLKEAGALLLDIYGQHEHQSLLNKKKHMELLDQFAQSQAGKHQGALRQVATDEFTELKMAVSTAYSDYSKMKSELEHATMDASDQVREASYLEHEIEEIRSAELKIGEDEELENRYRLMKNSEKIAASLNRIEGMLSEDNAAADLVGRSLSELTQVASFDEEGLKDILSSLTDIDGLLSDLTRDLADYRDAMEFDQEEFQETEQRLDLVNDLKNRYGNTIQTVLDQLEEKESRLEKLQDYDAYLDRLRNDLAKKEEELQQLCLSLTACRKTSAKELTELVTKALMDLNFLDVRFEMHFAKLDHFTANGVDDCEFMIAMNPGQPMRPLQDTASGGELSRIMLAIKTVLAEQDDIDTLIFDEIDTGISGRTAQKVSEKLAQVGKRHQVICITHLPQIASMADYHYLVEKKVENNQTVSGIKRLSEMDAVSELARMLGGTEITDTVRKSAEEMRVLAREAKKNW